MYVPKYENYTNNLFIAHSFPYQNGISMLITLDIEVTTGYCMVCLNYTKHISHNIQALIKH